MLIGQVLRASNFLAVESLVRSSARRALAVSTSFSDDALGYFTERLDPTPTRARPVDPEKEPARRRWSEFCSPGFPSATQDGCGPRGSSGRIQKANVSDGVHSRQ